MYTLIGYTRGHPYDGRGGDTPVRSELTIAFGEPSSVV